MKGWQTFGFRRIPADLSWPEQWERGAYALTQCENNVSFYTISPFLIYYMCMQVDCWIISQHCNYRKFQCFNAMLWKSEIWFRACIYFMYAWFLTPFWYNSSGDLFLMSFKEQIWCSSRLALIRSRLAFTNLYDMCSRFLIPDINRIQAFYLFWNSFLSKLLMHGQYIIHNLLTNHTEWACVLYWKSV